MTKMDYIDFSTLSDRKVRKKLLQPMEAEEFAERLKLYFESQERYNFYSLSLFFGMSDQRFKSNYLESKDLEVKHLAQKAMAAMASHAIDNVEQYAKSIRYILARQATGKDFIELDESVQESNKAQIVVLPAKE